MLVLDEIQKIPRWSDVVKRLWDEDTRARRRLKVVLLGSAPLLMQQGLTESLAGRFEVVHLPHWSYAEMRAAFGFSLDEYLYFGGYPGAAPLIGEPQRWRRYLLDALIETTISRDVLLDVAGRQAGIAAPALRARLPATPARSCRTRRCWGSCRTRATRRRSRTTSTCWQRAGMLTGLQKYSGKAVRQRGSSPKLQVLNTALMTAQSGLSMDEARNDREFRGRLVESAVGAHLANAAADGACELFYWREQSQEVDFVARAGRIVVAIEVKSGRAPAAFSGLEAFSRAFKPTRTLLVGGDGIPVDDFLSKPVEHWLR